MGKFLDICNSEPVETLADGYHNTAYNEWKEKCIRKIVETYREEYPNIFQLQKEEAVEEKVITTQDSENFSTGVVGGIGAASAAGGAGLAVGVPAAIKALLKLFKVL